MTIGDGEQGKVFMNVLIAENVVGSNDENPYVSSLAEGLRNLGIYVDCSIDSFWNPHKKYDVIHIQWPEALTGWSRYTKETVSKIRQKIDDYHKMGVCVIYTRHNACSHYSSSESAQQLYNVVESGADGIIHLGTYSRDDFIARQINKTACHYVIPHQVYDVASKILPAENAKSILGLCADKPMVLAFGAFRNDNERKLYFEMCKQVKKSRDVAFLAPGLFRTPILRKNVKKGLQELLHRLKFLRYGWFKTQPKVPEDLVSVYFSAADVVFVQRNNILNSGNIPLAYSYGDIVVGPNIGNMGGLLSEYGNPTFDPQSGQSVATAVCAALDAAILGLGDENRRKACADWPVSKIAEMTLRAYEDICAT